MPKTLVVGDLHLKQSIVLPLLDEAVRRTGASRVVFLGDYVDDWGATAADEVREMRALAGWVASRRAGGLSVTCLLGNHDWAYLEGIQEVYTHLEVQGEVGSLMRGLRPRLAAVVGECIVTHAGLTRRWAEANGIPLGGLATPESVAELLDSFLSVPGSREHAALYDCGRGRGGYGLPGPLWADLRELEADAPPGLPQIVGHTPRRTVSLVEPVCDEPTTIVCADTLSTNRDGRPIGDASLLLVDETTLTFSREYLGTDDRPWAQRLSDARKVDRLTHLGPLPMLHSLMRGYDGPKPEPVDLDGLPQGRELW